MLRYQSLAICLLVIITLLSGANAEASLPDQLKYYNFNLYPSPCPANDMVLRDLRGREVSLGARRGKVIILNFWKIDCPPCATEKPILERIYRKYASRGLEIVAVNLVDDQQEMLTYVQKGGYSFTFAFDPSRTFSLRQQALRSGTPATFVVNPKSEAIYEIPGVPTTYVINRQGQVVGNAVGLMDWEQKPFTDLLESLLGPAATVAAQASPGYSEVARQGSTQSFSPEAYGTARAETPRLRQVAQAQPSTSSSRQDAPVLPFQGASTLQRPAAGPPPVSQTPAGSTSTQAPTYPQAYEPPATPARPQKKPEPARAKTVVRTPKPYVPTTTGVSGPSTQSAVTGAAGAKNKPSAGKPAAAPPVPQPFASSVPSTVTPVSPMPYLPPATPYNPSTPQGAPTNVIPDDNGTVTARIPSNAPAPGFDRFGGAGRPPSATLPPAQPLSTGNPIDGFILDSFGRPRAQEAGASRTSDKPASSLFGQIGQDVQNLGSGIKDTFSRIIPGR